MAKGKKERARILVVGDAVATTGFARVLHSIFTNLSSKYEIHHLGVNYRGDPHDFDYKIYPAMLGGDIYGLKRLDSLVSSIKPRVIFILNDIWVHHIYMQELKKINCNIPVILYFPVDSGPIEPKWIDSCKEAKRLLVYTNFAKTVIDTATEQLYKKNKEFVCPPVEIVPHGVDKNRFYPLPDKDGLSGRLLAKKLLFPNTEPFLNSFVILNANRNQPRKRIDITLKGFTEFAKDKPQNVKLYLHMGVEDVGWNIIDLAGRYHIDDRLIISSTINTIPGVSDERLNLIYNACDVGLNTSVGEGWGLTSWEHAATKAPQVVPKHSACEELWEGRAILMEPSLYLTNERVLTEGGIVTPRTVAQALQLIYENAEIRQTLTDKAYEYVTQEKFSWEEVSKQVDRIISEVLSE